MTLRNVAIRILLTLAGALVLASGARAGAPAGAPQVLLAITNSESMDGTTAGAIMVGSGGLTATHSSLTASSSPVNYAIPNGFTPPLDAGSGGYAPYTVACSGSYKCDNGPSRMNMTKASIGRVLATHGSSLNFGLYLYGTGSPSLYSTWVYYMSPPSGFTFTNTASSGTVPNPCRGYPRASAGVLLSCTSLAAQYPVNVVATSAYINVATSSDDPLINDVLYYAGSAIGSTLLTYGRVVPSNPYSHYPLATYNNSLNRYVVGYDQTAPNVGAWSTTPTNAGYVPYAPQVLYAARGFGYGASQSATTGAVKVAMGTDPAASTAFASALAPETNNASSSEIKSVAGQSALYGLLNGAKTYLSGLATASCQGRYVVLLTDGLPTLDKSGAAWPPLGTTTANAYNLTAAFGPDGAFSSSNSQAVTDAVASVTALYEAGIKVFVIGLGAGVDPTTNPMAAKVLQAMAIAGGTGSYYPATDSTTLDRAFLTIVDLIHHESSVAAPVAPVSVAGGSSYEYGLTSIASPAAGHVKAYAVNPAGVASTTASWDAASGMTTSDRTRALRAADAGNAVVTLADVDAAAFGLAATTCVPNVSTIIAYTVDPAYRYNGCSYLAGRDSASLLGAFSTRNTGRHVGPPASSLLTHRYPTYAAYARVLAGRTPMLMFTNQDGFLYAIDADSGALRWGWTSRHLLAKLQNYGTFATSGYTDGNFAVVDAMNASGAWGSYLIGSLQSGAEHFSVRLDAAGTPTAVVYDNLIASGSSAGDKAGAGPLRQPPVIAYIGSRAYHVYVVTVGTTSTLYETDVATGATTSSTLGFRVSSALTLNPTTRQLYLGGADGTVWTTTLASGTAATDAALLLKVGTTVSPTSGSTSYSVLYVGYAEVAGVPYVYALNPAQLTVFGVTSAGWTALWASTPDAGYRYSGSTWSASNTATPLTAGSIVSDFPLVVGSALLVPVYVAGSGCSAGHGDYDFFDLGTGAFPTHLTLTRSATAITANLTVGIGIAYTPSITFVNGGIALNPGSAGSTAPQLPLINSGGLGAKAIGWRQH